jgi:Pyruvate/2-oxoacid:ferredoxin oxidoreductase delta subunit
LNQAKVLNTSGFDPLFDSDLCTACGTCVERCPAQTISIGDDDFAVALMDRCFGCAVCATGCPEDAISMVTKPGFEAPPKDKFDMRDKMISAFKEKMG